MVFKDLDESIYFFKYNKLYFYFSSKLYLEKYIKSYIQFLKDETMKMKIKYKCNIVADEMILLLLYKKIEKRGFKVTYNGKELKEHYFIDVKLDDIESKR